MDEYLLYSSRYCVMWSTESKIIIFLTDRESLSKVTHGPSEVCGSLRAIGERRDGSENLFSSSQNAD